LQLKSFLPGNLIKSIMMIIMMLRILW
jgi:hypothetical protein